MSQFTIPAGTGVHYLPTEFALEHGGVLHAGQLAYELTGAEDAPLVIVLGGISAGRHVAATPADPSPGWWNELVGAGRAIDTDRYRVLGVDFLAGSGASTGPRTASDGTEIPVVSSRDQARAIASLVEDLGVARVHRIVGSSFGGMVGLAFAAEFGDRLDGLVCLAAAHESHPMARGWRSLQRRIVELGQSVGEERRAVELARGLAMTTYRSHDEFRDRFAQTSVEDYLEARGAAFAATYSGDEFLLLSEAIDTHRVDPATVAVPTLLVGFGSDQLVPIEQLRALQRQLGTNGRLVEVATRYGHDGFLKETVALAPILTRALAEDVIERPAPREKRKILPKARDSVTRAVRSGLESDTQHGAVVPPLHLSSNFTFAGFDQKREYDYTRSGNPTRDVLARALADLENGAGAVVTSSGMSAITVVLQLLSPGDLLIAPHDCYGGTYRSITRLAEKGHFELLLVDQTDPDALRAALSRRPAMVWVETPSNPLLRITDIASVVDLAQACDALVVVDNTFLSPVYQRPLDLGADIVVHSTTKYLNGHSDVVGGAAIAATDELHETLAFWGNCLGLTGAPFDSYLTLRGLRTLHARMRAHETNVEAIVALLAEHPAVAALHYPGLATHPGHDLARRQQLGFGCMLSFELEAGYSVRGFLEGLRCFSLAESLGGVESLVAHPATMTHAAMDPEARAAAGISDRLVRLSVGIEAPEDLVADLRQALAAV